MALAVASLIERYRRLRSQPMWSLLAADTGSETIACLQVLLYDTDRRLAQSVFAERLLRLLNAVSLEIILNIIAELVIGYSCDEAALCAESCETDCDVSG